MMQYLLEEKEYNELLNLSGKKGKRKIKLSEQTLLELLSAVKKVKKAKEAKSPESPYIPEIIVCSDYCNDEFLIDIETQPHSQESLGYRIKNILRG